MWEVCLELLSRSSCCRRPWRWPSSSRKQRRGSWRPWWFRWLPMDSSTPAMHDLKSVQKTFDFKKYFYFVLDLKLNFIKMFVGGHKEALIGCPPNSLLICIFTIKSYFHDQYWWYVNSSGFPSYNLSVCGHATFLYIFSLLRDGNNSSEW